MVWKSSQQVWTELHEQALRYFGGCPQYVVLDKLKEGVIKPDLYEPQLNAVYAAPVVVQSVTVRLVTRPWVTQELHKVERQRLTVLYPN